MWHLKSIQYLRGIAATMVVMTHVLRTANVLVDFHFIGAAGVDIFFVISGFLMWSINNKNERPAGEFMLDRLARIVPLYWIVTLLIVCLAIFTPFYKDADVGAAYVWKSLLFIPDFQPGTFYVRPLLGVGWTLNFEMAFYALFAVALLPSRKWRLFIIAAPLVLLPLTRVFLLPRGPVEIFLTDSIAIEFLAGVLLAIYVSNSAPLSNVTNVLLIIAGTVTIALSCLLPNEEDSWLRLMVWGMPAVALVGGSIGLERRGVLPTLRFFKRRDGPARLGVFERLGDASYSLYLTHILSVRAVHRVLDISHVWQPLALALIAPFVAIVVSLIIYATVETPIRRLIRPLLRAKKQKTLATTQSAVN